MAEGKLLGISSNLIYEESIEFAGHAQTLSSGQADVVALVLTV